MRTLVRAVRANGLLLAIAAVLCAFNYHWWTLLANQRPAAKANAFERALLGTTAPPIVAQASSGEWARLEFDANDRDVLLYITSPSCEWCARNMANIKALAAVAEAHYRIIVLLSDPGNALQYASANELRYPIYSSVSASSKEAYGMIGTPQTIIIRNGLIAGNWIGAYSGSRQHDIETFFKIDLPGLLAVNAMGSGQPERVGCAGADGGFYSPGASITVLSHRKRCDPSGQWIDQK